MAESLILKLNLYHRIGDSMNKVLKKLIDKSEVISFDIFDTLIKRNCIVPTDVFKYVEIMYNYSGKNKISNFFDSRIEAEKLARQKSDNNEVTLDEIYENMLAYDKSEREKLKKIEIETEYNFCQKNNKMFEIYEYCLKKGKKIICISDMYLREKELNKILSNNGYDIKDIYVSCEHNCSKYSGELFKVVLKKIEVDPRKVLHIGDSKRADFLSPLKNGMRSYYIKRHVKNTKYINLEQNNTDELSNNLIYSLINNNSNKIDNYYEKIGYEILGPISCAFVYWVNSTAIKLNVDNLLFCARDMKMVQKIYNIIIDKNKINNSYFYISRKSSFLPFLFANNEYKDFLRLLPEGKRKISMDELLLSFNININDLEKKLKKYGLSLENKYDLNELRADSKFKKFYETEILDFISSEGKKQYDNFMNYLKTLKISNSTAIVDLGWHGTTQMIMTRILKYDIKGLYLGLYGRDNNYVTEQNCFSYVFDENSKEYSSEIFSFLTLFEILFSALHGSASYYTDDKNCPCVLDEPKNDGNEYISSIQNGAIRFASDFAQYSKYFDEIKLDTYINELIRMGISPNLREAKNLGNINTENLKVRRLASPGCLFYYVFHLKHLKNDFTNAEWKIGFMKRLFKINFPYYRLYSYFKRLRDGR